MTQKKRATLRELADSIGVHSSTVSRVMNPDTRHLISADVVERVLKAARQLKYSPNRIAATLRTKRSGIIGVVLPDITNPVFPPILRGIEDELAKKGLIPLIANAEGGKERQRFVIDQMVGRHVDGLILATSGRTDPVLEHCLEEGLPIVVVNRSEESGRVSCVVSDNHMAMSLAVSHLIQLGHKRLAHVAGPSELSTGFERRQGFLDAIKLHGLRKNTCPIADTAAYSREAGRLACDFILDKHPGITGIVAANDLLALGCYDALRARGLRCPQDVSIVGHNDMPLMDSIFPPMTTVHIPLYEMGVRAANLMLDTLEGDSDAHVNVVLRPELIVRESTMAVVA
ncbi:LacI family DNA-binding transcriptional regulator [Paraburkholderia fungorum]|uniref:LacI family transcriptional regulator n=1 Tax=Paraburkholderia fungorum TaxID=134537 RepID=A0A420FNG1_9BURK|nr:LacI family DNA-binding transcriptional regulator [Paraburkholderia fungorum]RKF34444.1 LacI family transcriptional regulator [Paraburkholderia fungorum]